MLADLPKWGKEVSLIPNSGIQFMDFAFDIEDHKKLSRDFIERATDGSADREHLTLLRIPTLSDDEPMPQEFQLRDNEIPVDINTAAALEIFTDKWVPVPYLRVKDGHAGFENPAFVNGPTNWARVRVTVLPNRMRGDGPSHHVTFAFDTAIEEKRPNRSYTALGLADVQQTNIFRFASQLDDMGWFFAGQSSEADPNADREYPVRFQDWVDHWLMECYAEYMKARYPRQDFHPNDMEHPLEHWMRYVAFLETLDAALDLPKIKITDTISRRADRLNPKVDRINVDLVVDIGNSRTCGLLIEQGTNKDKGIDLNDARVLQLRDLGAPERVYTDPFSSHVEIAQARFGRNDLSQRVSRRAFFWPSLVRVGPEALRIRGAAKDTGPTSGMSSPKRYLWDTDPFPSPWSFQPGDYGHENRPPPIWNAVANLVNDSGDVLSYWNQQSNQARRNKEARNHRSIGLSEAQEFTFSRSSFFTHLLVEILMQAITMANSPAYRSKRKPEEPPRVIRNVILTLPPATTVRERQLMDERAQAAVSLLWDVMGWSAAEIGDTSEEYAHSVLPRPTIRTDIDEASCTQFVWLYSEIADKFSGAADRYAELVGKKRPFAEPDQEPGPDAPHQDSIRVASIDVGGGTTDLMVTTYYMGAGRTIEPTQNFREGFRIAGDDLLRAVIETMIIPAISGTMVEQGYADARPYLQTKLGPDRPNMSVQEKQMRRQVALRLLQPLGHAILSEHENRPRYTDHEVEIQTIGALLGDVAALRVGEGKRAIPDDLLEYIESGVRAHCPDFRLEDVQIPLDFGKLRRTTDQMMGEIANNICEAIKALDVDVVLISGRPARFPAISDLFTDRLPTLPDRIVTFSDYRVGTWYPFRDADNTRMSDPKTCTAVGAMLCVLAERQMENFVLLTHRLSMRSTARYIGVMEPSGEIKRDNVLFSDDAEGDATEEAPHQTGASIRIGFRQVPHQRWTTTQLYRLDLPDPAQVVRDRDKGKGVTARLPYSIHFKREMPEIDPEEEDLGKVLQTELKRENITVVEVFDKDEMPVRKEFFKLKLCTLQGDGDYWLETGSFKVS